MSPRAQYIKVHRLQLAVATKTISITLDAYRRLQRLKREQESFSDVIKRLTGRGDLMAYSGSISEAFAEELAAASTDFRRRFERDARAR